jgi:hypothetical protein
LLYSFQYPRKRFKVMSGPQKDLKNPVLKGK